MKKHPPQLLCAVAAAAATFALTACGGGGSDSGAASTAASTSLTTDASAAGFNRSSGSSSSTAAANAASSTALGASAGSESSGTISAFGSVFVNGHEYDTSSARVYDDDTNTWTTGTSSLQVGMSASVRSGSYSSYSNPTAAEVHVRPLVRGYVDASNTGTSAMTVLGQSVLLTSATNWSDTRACRTSTTAPCAAITGQSGLAATSGTGTSATAGTYVTVYGYQYANGSSNMAGTLVWVSDASSTTNGVNYKVEGIVTAVGTNTVTIGGTTINYAGATCYGANYTGTTCASSFSVGQYVSAYGTASPTLPATSMTATVMRQRYGLLIPTTGASVELEGKVSSVSTTAPATFVIRGVTVNASALTSLPAVGDTVRVVGTVASSNAVTASAATVLQLAGSMTYGFEGTLELVAAGATAGTYTVSVLGETVNVSETARLADRSGASGSYSNGWGYSSNYSSNSGYGSGYMNASYNGSYGNGSYSNGYNYTNGSYTTTSGTAIANPFNITTFQTYLNASVSKHVQVRASVDASGRLVAQSVTILPASTVSAVTGIVDNGPVFNSTATGTPTTFTINGMAISADPSSIVKGNNGRYGTTTTAGTIAVGDLVTVRGTYSSGKVTVAAATTTAVSTKSSNWGNGYYGSYGNYGSYGSYTNQVIDSGIPSSMDYGCF